MKGDATSTENEEVEGKGGQSVAAENAFGERRQSIVALQTMLKRVSQSPFHSQYKTLVSSTSDSSGSSANEPQSKQIGAREPPAVGAQNGVGGASARKNPFYTQYLESTRNSRDTEEAWGRTSEELNVEIILAPPPQFQSSPLDLQPQIPALQTRGELPEPQEDIFHSFQTAEFFQNTPANGAHFHSINLNTPDVFKPNSHQPLDPFKSSKSSNSNLFKDKDEDLLQSFPPAAPAKGGNLLHRSPSDFLDPFKSPNEGKCRSVSTHSKEENPLFSAPNKEVDLFQAAAVEKVERFNAGERHLFQSPFRKKEEPFERFSEENLDIFSPLSSKPVDPFPSLSDSFPNSPDVDDSFGPAASNRFDPFRAFSHGTPDVLRPLPSSSRGVSETSPSCKAAQPLAHSLNGPSEPLSFSPVDESADLSAAAKPAGSLPAASNAIVLTTPHGTNRRILQPTPFSLAGVPASPPSPTSGEGSPVQPFKRPPKPLPRTRPPRTAKPPRPPNPVKTESEPNEPVTPPKWAPEPLPKPSPRTKDNKDLTKVEPEDFDVLEDVLLLGQERCVEDWPEDSPQLNADFKPSGKLRLRRESMRVDPDGGRGQDGSVIKKKDRKFRLSVVSRSLKDKVSDDVQDERSKTLPTPHKASKDYFTETGENEDEDQYGMDYKAKKPLRAKVTNLLRRASTSAAEMKRPNGHLPRGSKEDDLHEEGAGKRNAIARRWREAAGLGGVSSGEGEDATHDEADGLDDKRRKRLKVKFVPHRGFAITVAKRDKEHGTRGRATLKGSKEKALDEELGACGYSPRKKPQDDDLEDEDALTMAGCTLQSYTKAALVDDEPSHRARKASAGLTADEGSCGVDDCKPRKPTRLKLRHVGRRRSKDDMLDEASPQRSSISAEEREDDEQSEMDHHKLKKPSKLKGLKTRKAKNKLAHEEREGAAWATSSDNYVSEAAQAEWLASQRDELAAAGTMDEEEEGDTDSLMEWWNTVEQWDEVPSDDEENDMKEDESKSFTILADKVQRGLCVFNKIFTERAEVLWQFIVTLHAIADNISTFHHKAKIASITGGTTTAVGGVAAIAGLALAPVTFGASLLITAVGVGVATAGGITSASAAISDNVNNMHDRKKVEVILQEYEVHLLDIAKILHFVNHGVYKLRGHPFLRTGTQHYSEDWEIRRSVQLIGMVDSPVMRAVDIVDDAVASVKGLFKGMDKFFAKDARELKKGCKKEVVSQIKGVATVLNDGIVELNAIREELQDANGNF